MYLVKSGCHYVKAIDGKPPADGAEGMVSLVEDCLFYDGVYYGDWSIFDPEACGPRGYDEMAEKFRVFDENLSEPPARPPKPDPTYQLCEVVADLMDNMAAKRDDGSLQDVTLISDSRAMISTVIGWAKEFEANEQTLADGEDYIGRVDAFFELKFQELIR